DFNQLVMHCLISGMSGSGKSNLVFVLALQLLKKYPIHFFDIKKEYRSILKYCGDVLVIRNNKHSRNILEVPESVKPREWLSILSEVVGNVFMGDYIASKNVFNKAVDTLYRKKGIYDGGKNFPTIIDLNAYFYTLKMKTKYYSQEKEHAERWIKYLDPLISVHRDIISSPHGYPLDKLLSKNVVHEFDGFSLEHYALFVSDFLARIFYERMSKNLRGRGLDLVIVFDEANRI
ncbi:unnamed protein product, partial [marine sediment metagenome]